MNQYAYPQNPGMPPSYGQRPNSGLAIASLILGILSLVTVGLLSLPAIVCGHMARSRIKKSGEAIGGAGMALAGLIMGYIMLGVLVVIVLLATMASLSVPVFARIQERGMIVKAEAQANQVFFGASAYANENDGVLPESLDELVDDGVLEWDVFDSPSPSSTSEDFFILLAPGEDLHELQSSDPSQPIIVTRGIGHEPPLQHVVIHAGGSVVQVSGDELPAEAAAALE